MRKSFEIHSDPGHAWCKVDIITLCKLGIAGKISPYSYWRKGFAYLEEDLDLGLLIKAMNERGHQIKFRERVSRERPSRIRNYEGYQSRHYL